MSSGEPFFESHPFATSIPRFIVNKLHSDVVRCVLAPVAIFQRPFRCIVSKFCRQEDNEMDSHNFAIASSVPESYPLWGSSTAAGTPRWAPYYCHSNPCSAGVWSPPVHVVTNGATLSSWSVRVWSDRRLGPERCLFASLNALHTTLSFSFITSPSPSGVWTLDERDTALRQGIKFLLAYGHPDESLPGATPAERIVEKS